jgi:DNA-binding MarR family transcriptional regulator
MDVIEALSTWARKTEERRLTNFDEFVVSIAEGRYVMRKVTRIVDDEAKRQGLDPLEHQAMLQAYGAGKELRTVSQLAERLDVAPALASRVVNSLATKGLIVRRSAESDKRVTKIEISPKGVALIRQIDQKVHIAMEYFSSQLGDDQRLAALAIFTKYLGFGSLEPSQILGELEDTAG